MSDKAQDMQAVAEKACTDKKVLDELVESLSGASRRTRQTAASTLALVARQSPEVLVEHVDAVIDALNRPESQTRWEALEILCVLVGQDSRMCDKALQGAETALFDEDSGFVRLSALRFMCTIGSTTENRSEKVWPLLDEAIQCYHGDLEFQDMLVAIADFASGKISPTVKTELIERMRFDAESGKGVLKKRAQIIIDNAS